VQRVTRKYVRVTIAAAERPARKSGTCRAEKSQPDQQYLQSASGLARRFTIAHTILMQYRHHCGPGASMHFSYVAAPQRSPGGRRRSAVKLPRVSIGQRQKGRQAPLYLPLRRTILNSSCNTGRPNLNSLRPRHGEPELEYLNRIVPINCVGRRAS